MKVESLYQRWDDHFPVGSMSFLEVNTEEPEFDQKRFQEAILYVCSIVKSVRDISKTKLHKILYYADREAYVRLGEAITGETYIRHQFGPYSERLEDTLQDLDEKGDILIRKYRNDGVELSPVTQTCPDVYRRADTDVFSEEELKILTNVAREIFEQDSETVSRESHNIVWRSVDPFDKISYETAHLDVSEPDERDEIQEWAQAKAEEVDL